MTSPYPGSSLMSGEQSGGAPWGEHIDEVADLIAKATGTYLVVRGVPSRPRWTVEASRAACAHFDAINARAALSLARSENGA